MFRSGSQETFREREKVLQSINIIHKFYRKILSRSIFISISIIIKYHVGMTFRDDYYNHLCSFITASKKPPSKKQSKTIIRKRNLNKIIIRFSPRNISDII